MKKTILFLLTLLALFLVGCSSDLPPEPGAPGLSGNYYRAIGEWATEPDTFNILGNDVFECSIGETVSFNYIVSGDDYVYNKLYIWDEASESWTSALLEGDQVPDSNWLRGFSKLDANNVPCEDVLELMDENDEFFAVVYSCSRRTDGSWDCNDDRWQLQILSVTEKEVLPPEPKEPGEGDNETGTFQVPANDYTSIVVDGQNFDVSYTPLRDPAEPYVQENLIGFVGTSTVIEPAEGLSEITISDITDYYVMLDVDGELHRVDLGDEKEFYSGDFTIEVYNILGGVTYYSGHNDEYSSYWTSTMYEQYEAELIIRYDRGLVTPAYSLDYGFFSFNGERFLVNISDTVTSGGADFTLLGIEQHGNRYSDSLVATMSAEKRSDQWGCCVDTVAGCRTISASSDINACLAADYQFEPGVSCTPVPGTNVPVINNPICGPYFG